MEVYCQLWCMKCELKYLDSPSQIGIRAEGRQLTDLKVLVHWLNCRRVLEEFQRQKGKVGIDTALVLLVRAHGKIYSMR